MRRKEFNFFSEFPTELLVEIYSKLDSENSVLKAWWVLNRRQQQIIEIALFCQKEIKFYSCQIKLFFTLTHTQVPILKNDKNHLNEICRLFFARLQNPELEFDQKVQGFALLAAYKNIAIDISSFLQNFRQQDNNLFLNGLNAIKPIAALLSQESNRQLIKFAESKLAQHLKFVESDSEDCHLKICLSCLEFISKAAFSLKKEERKTKAATIATLLNHPQFIDSKFELFSPPPLLLETSIDCLALLTADIDEELLKQILELISLHLSSPRHYIKLESITGLTSLAAKIKGPALEPLISSIVATLEDKELYIRLAALNCLTAMVPNLSEITKESLVEPICLKLKDPDYSVCKAALIWLHHYKPELAREESETIAVSIKEILNKQHWPEIIVAFHRLLVIIPHISNETRINLLPLIKQKLFTKINPNCLVAIIPYLSNEMVEDLVEVILKKLDKKPTVCAAALDRLKVMIPSLKTETTILIYEKIMAYSAQDEPSIQKAIFDCLALLAPRLPQENILTMIELLKTNSSDPNPSVSASILACLAVLLTRLDSQQLEEVIPLLETKLAHPLAEVRLIALNCFYSLFFLNTDLLSKMDSSLPLTVENLVKTVLVNCLNSIKQKFAENLEELEMDSRFENSH